MIRLLFALLFCVPLIAAANNDDGFVWLDANTKIKVVKPVSASAGETKAAGQPSKDKKADKRKK
ncbi:MAG TPA: hypothetical protein VNC62_03750 [Burkholderiales bacterium]|jgi:hypothetical protein|nr:hypothetical protein [Burkholderiales bacterium]HVJ23751.1 hypothetical protein [Burkholderiales bacterium]